MKNLLIIAHGSRRQASNDEVRHLSERIADITGDNFVKVQAAFLELAEPSIPEGIHQCIGPGVEELVILPYFLSAGRHVSEDIPAEVDKVKHLYPDVDIQIAPYLGAIDTIADIMADHACNTIHKSDDETMEISHAGNNN